MKKILRIMGTTAVLLCLITSACSDRNSDTSAGALDISASLGKDVVEILVDGQLFTRYLFNSSLKLPYLFPVVGPLSNHSLTTESSEPYPHHHSIFFGCDRVNGANFWQEGNDRGQILSQGPELILAAGKRVVLTDTCLWKQPGLDPVARDTRRLTFSAPGEDMRFIDFEITVEALVPIRIEKTNHSLFSVRMDPELSVDSGGTLVNAGGKMGEAGTFGIPSAWCDYSGKREGISEGIAILQHPANRWFPSRWFTRDYGFFSPTPMYWPENDSHINLGRGETINLRYRVVIHAGNAKAARIMDLFESYGSQPIFTTSRLQELVQGIVNYKPGGGRQALTDTEALITACHYSEDDQARIATKLAAVLSADISLAAKRFACRQLSRIGSDESVPALAALLAAEETAGMARFALERIGSSAASGALVGALADVGTGDKTAIIHSLASFSDSNSRSVLTNLALGDNQVQAVAAIRALAGRHDNAIIRVLEKVVKNSTGNIQSEALHTLLGSARHLLDTNRSKAAEPLFKKIFNGPYPDTIRSAALVGLLECGGSGSRALIDLVLEEKNQPLQATLFKTAHTLKTFDWIEAGLERFDQFSPRTKTQFLSALPGVQSADTHRVISASLKSENGDTRIAALKALGRSGTTADVLILARISATSRGREREAARESLDRLNGPGLDPVFIEALKESEQELLPELIRSAAARGIGAAGAAVINLTQADDSDTRREAIRALQLLANESHFPGLTERMLSAVDAREKGEWVASLGHLMRNSDSKDMLTLLQNHFLSDKSTLNRASLLAVIGQRKNSDTHAALKTALENTQSAVRRAAIRALADWDQPDPLEDLSRRAREDPDPTNRVLALRGLLRLMTLPTDRSESDSVHLLSSLIGSAPLAEKRAILSILPRFPGDAAVQLAESYTRDPQLKKEAEAALLNLTRR